MAAAMVAARAAAMAAEAMSTGAMSAAAMSAAAMWAVAAETAAASRGAVAVAAMVAVATAARGRQGGAGVGGLDERERLPPLPPKGVQNNNWVSSRLQNAPIRGVCSARPKALAFCTLSVSNTCRAHARMALVYKQQGAACSLSTRVKHAVGGVQMEQPRPYVMPSRKCDCDGSSKCRRRLWWVTWKFSAQNEQIQDSVKSHINAMNIASQVSHKKTIASQANT